MSSKLCYLWAALCGGSLNFCVRGTPTAGLWRRTVPVQTRPGTATRQRDSSKVNRGKGHFLFARSHSQKSLISHTPVTTTPQPPTHPNLPIHPSYNPSDKPWQCVNSFFPRLCVAVSHSHPTGYSTLQCPRMKSVNLFLIRPRQSKRGWSGLAFDLASLDTRRVEGEGWGMEMGLLGGRGRCLVSTWAGLA